VEGEKLEHVEGDVVGNEKVEHVKGNTFRWRLQVRHYEIDQLGHVNNAVYLNYLEQAAIAHCAALGFTPQRLIALGGLFVARRHEIDFLASAVAGDSLVVETWPAEMCGARAYRLYEVRRDDLQGAGALLVKARTLWAWVDVATGRPKPMPRALLDAFATTAAAPATPADV